MKNILSVLVLVLAYMLIPGSAYSQVSPADTTANRPDTNLYRIMMNDDNEFIGRIVQQDSVTLRLRTEKLGELTLQRKDIARISAVRVEQVRQDGLWAENPQSTRYLFAPNGYGLKQGEGYYQNSWVLFNQVSYGITDNISIGAGLIPLFLFGGDFSYTPVWITPKVSVPVIPDQLNIGVGALVGTVPAAASELAGIGYAVATFGSRDNNLTVGAGYGFAGSEFGTTPLFTLSGMRRLTRKLYILTENYFIIHNGSIDGAVSLGGRWIYQTASLDFGLIIPPFGNDFYTLPWLGFTIPFGR